MTYRQSKIEPGFFNELDSVLSLEKFVEHTVPTKRTPFCKPNFFLIFLKKVKKKTARIVQLFFGATLYISDDKSLIYQLPPETRAFLSWLVSKNLLASWSFGRPLLQVDSVKTIYLRPMPTVTPSGSSYTPSGANGIGAGATFADAALSALGEFVERNASGAYWWENSSLFTSVYKNGSSQVDPATLDIFAENQDVYEGGRFKYQAKTEIGWTKAKNFLTQKICYIPASLVYMYYQNDFKTEPFFREVSTNGAAAYTNYHEASTRATLELIERHAFMKMWYHKIPSNKVSIESLIPVFPELNELLESMSDREQFDVYEITDSFGIPTFFATLSSTDPSRTALHVTAASDLDHKSAIDKVIKESIRFAEDMFFSEEVEKPSINFSDNSELSNHASSLMRRWQLWSNQEMLPKVSWLKNSPTVDYFDLKYSTTSAQSHADRYQVLQKICAENDLTVYIADVTNSVAKYAGLKVVRAVSANLIPIFFNEQYKPLAYNKFTHDEAGVEVQLNPVPHPFI